MRIAILSVCGAALAVALPAAGHGWSPRSDIGLGGHNCPILQPSHRGLQHHGYGGAHRRGRGGCPVAVAGGGRYAYERVHTRDGHVGGYAGVGMQERGDRAYDYGHAWPREVWGGRHGRVGAPEQRDWSFDDEDAWRRDRHSWSDGDWSGRMAGAGAFGCRDANGPQAYRDRDGGHRAARDFGMRCHDGAMHGDAGYARWGGAFGYTSEVDAAWSSERGAGWSEERGWASGRPSMTDRYGYLTWPGKTHFLHGQPIADADAAGPRGPGGGRP